MGYTHYWDASKNKINNDALNIIVKIIDHGIMKGIIDPEDNSKNNREIKFNGIGSYSHEDFCYSTVREWRFCKTARKPYDLYVCSCLLVIKFYDDDMRFSSDGDYSEGEWKDAIDFLLACQKTFNLPINLVKSLEKIQNNEDLFKIYPYYEVDHELDHEVDYELDHEMNHSNEIKFIFHRSCAFNLDRKIGETDEQLKERAIQMASEILDEDESNPICIHSSYDQMVDDV